MTEEEFCKLYTGYYGEEIDKIEQLVQSNFTGEELKEFCDYIAESLSLPSVMPRCKTCSHWKRDNNFEWGFCSKIDDEVDIELETGWDGGYVSCIETKEDFGCTGHNEA